jgi:hypothetical protein
VDAVHALLQKEWIHVKRMKNRAKMHLELSTIHKREQCIQMCVICSENVHKFAHIQKCGAAFMQKLYTKRKTKCTKGRYVFQISVQFCTRKNMEQHLHTKCIQQMQ